MDDKGDSNFLGVESSSNLSHAACLEELYHVDDGPRCIKGLVS